MYALPSNNIYESKYLDQIKQDQLKKSTTLWNKAQNPLDSGIIGFSSRYMDLENYDNSLTGQKIEQTHNNMVPFLKKNVTQNTNINTTENFGLARMTGYDPYTKLHKKQETENFFSPQKNLTNICGMKNNDDFYKSRINNFDIRHRNNDFPIEPVRVGPGLNQGFTSKGSGGFQQADTLEYTKPQSVNELRPQSDQRSRNFNIPMQAPAKKIDKRGMVGDLAKNRPETDYQKGKDSLFTTTGAEFKQTSRSIPNLIPTSRNETHVEYKGIATSDKKGIEDDYGKSNVMVYDNERQITETRTVVSNLTSTVKAIVAPITDTIRNSVKEFLIDAPRQHGNMQTSMMEKPTTYDPVTGSMKTTIKETTIHDADKTNLKGENGTYTALHDQAKTTVKETFIHDSDKLNLKGQEEGYTALYDDAKKTTKETTPIHDILRNIGSGTYKVTVYDPDIVAKKTNKETTVFSDLGFLGGMVEKLFGGYLSSNPEAKNTQKQFNNVEYTGGGDAMSKNPMSQESAYNAEIDGTREKILIDAGHTPNAGGKYVGLPKENVSMKSEKLVQDSISARQAGNISQVYQQTPELNKCVITKENEQLNSVENRLDTNTLKSLNNNPFSININPI
tara:strand:- start:19431 stop:21284 length:1854 start_codon:yes stop_codon:yes gene_type:complete